VTSENKLAPAVVEIVRADEYSILISSGLQDGQLVCTSLLDNPLPGTPVRIDQPDDETIGLNLGND